MPTSHPEARDLLDVAGVMFVVLNADGAVALINKKGCEILGYEEQEIVGRNWFEHFLPERLRKPVQEVFQRLMAGSLDPVEYYENPVLTSVGKERIIAWHNSVVTDEARNITGVLSSGLDVTDHRRAEEERARLAEEATRIAERERDRIWRGVERLSHAAIRITAQHQLDDVLQELADSARDVVGARYAALGVLNHEGDGLERFYVSGVSREQYEKIGKLPTGKGILGVLIADPRPLRLKNLDTHPDSYGFPKHHPPMRSFLGVPILGRDGPIGNLYLTEKRDAEEFGEQDEALAVMLAAHAAVAVDNARHNEERERLLAEVRSMQVSRDRFFAMINHELRNALTAVHGWAELWLRKAGDAAPRSAHEVFESANRAVTLLEDLLDLSRLDASKLEPKVEPTDAWKVVRESIGSVEPAAERRRVTIKRVGPDGGVSWRTDPQRVRQILINLLTNAVRHSPEQDTVTVRLEALDSSIRLHVEDHGPGLTAEEQAVIFQAFERAGRETERGTGLGLTLSRKLARLLGGDLTVESQPGAGAQFILQLPRGEGSL